MLYQVMHPGLDTQQPNLVIVVKLKPLPMGHHVEVLTDMVLKNTETHVHTHTVTGFASLSGDKFLNLHLGQT